MEEEEEEVVVLVSRRMERTVYSLLGGVGVTVVDEGLQVWSSVLLRCCLTSRRDSSEEKRKD